MLYDVYGLCVGFIICTLDIAVAQGQLEVGGNLVAPLAVLAILLGGFDGLVDLCQGRLIGLRDDAGNGVLLIAAVIAAIQLYSSFVQSSTSDGN